MPINKKRLNKRGYNQTELIAGELAKNLKISLSKNNLVKVKDIRVQSTLTKTERQKNVKNAFAILNKEELEHKKIILFDDIYTTGSTAKECSKILKKAGAKRILVLTIAKD